MNTDKIKIATLYFYGINEQKNITVTRQQFEQVRKVGETDAEVKQRLFTLLVQQDRTSDIMPEVDNETISTG